MRSEVKQRCCSALTSWAKRLVRDSNLCGAHSKRTLHPGISPDPEPNQCHLPRKEASYMHWAELARRLGTYRDTVRRCREGGTRPSAHYMMALLDLIGVPHVSHRLTRQGIGHEMPRSAPDGSHRACGQPVAPSDSDLQAREVVSSPTFHRSPSLRLPLSGLPEPNLSPHQIGETEES